MLSRGAGPRALAPRTALEQLRWLISQIWKPQLAYLVTCPKAHIRGRFGQHLNTQFGFPIGNLPSQYDASQQHMEPNLLN